MDFDSKHYVLIAMLVFVLGAYIVQTGKLSAQTRLYAEASFVNDVNQSINVELQGLLFELGDAYEALYASCSTERRVKYD